MMRYLMLTLLLCVGTLPLADPAHAIWKPKQEIESLDKLLDLVQQGRVEQSKENKEREQRFLAQKSKQEQLLQEAIAERKKLERRSELLETTYSENKEQLDELTRRLEKRMGSLKELFTH
ncbi:MAG: hypothetical protein ACPGZU_17030, partial [Ketobacter sp.]